MKIVEELRRILDRSTHDGEVDTISCRFPSLGLFWCMGFIYASLMALLLQKVVLPLLPEMHAGHGLLINDAILFHNIAAEMADRIHTYGWSEWRLFPPRASGNVGLLSAIYALLGKDPAWFIPVNAAAHAAGAVLIYKLGGRLSPGKVGLLGGLMAGIAFLTFPSALQWYGQNHKDAFAIAGMLLVLDASLELYSKHNASLGVVGSTVARAIGGTLLLGVVRPYFPVILAFALCMSAVIVSMIFVMRQPRLVLYSLVRQLPVIFVVSMIAVGFTRIDKVADVYGLSENMGEYTTATRDIWEWKTSKAVPVVIDKLLERASGLRAHIVTYGRFIGAGSEIDGARLPNDAWSALSYTPRAFVVGLFAPFPETWGERVSVPRLIGAVETAIWYVFALGFLITLLRVPSCQLLAGVIFCATLLVVLAYIHPNVGTLYRQRFGSWQFFLLCGAVGWANLILAILGQRARGKEEGRRMEMAADGVDQVGVASSGVDRLAASGAVVIMITLICYLGFFTRDLLLVRHLGMSAGLDAFFTAAMIPMFFVTFLSMPMADALTLPFLSVAGDGAAGRRDSLIRHLLGFAIVLLGIVAVVVVVAAPQIVSLILGENRSDKAGMAAIMLRWFAPIILLSAWTIIGNAALNALGRSRDAALGQLVVPVVTIAALASVSPENAAVAAIGGMLFGALLNQMWVLLCLRPYGIYLFPAVPVLPVLRPIALSYPRLVMAALLTAVLIPMNYTYAASVASGAISAWALSSKVVALFSGLASVGMSSVVLPYLAQLLSDGAVKGMRDDAYFLLVGSGWIGGLLAVGAVLFAQPLVGAALSGSLSQLQVVELANIVKVGVLQLPIVIAGALVAKMAIVSGMSSRVLFAAALGFVCNLLVNVLLVTRLGVMGVAIGALSATMISTLSLIVAVRRQVGLSARELLTLFVSWLVWAGVCVAVDSQSAAAIACASFAILGMAWAQFTIVQDSQELSVNEATV